MQQEHPGFDIDCGDIRTCVEIIRIVERGQRYNDGEVRMRKRQD